MSDLEPGVVLSADTVAAMERLAKGPAAKLAPAAQAVMDAAGASEPGIYATIAAALRAAADQVVPEDYNPPRTAFYPEAGAFVDGKERRNEDVRYQLLAIAVELETSTTENQ